MSMNKTDRDNWRKFLGIKDPSATLESGRVGGSIGRTAGRSGGGGGGGELDSDSVPEGEEEEGAEKGDGAGDAGEQIKVGDKFDRLEDLYDCETGEKVTIDGLGEKGSEKYPTGFQDCESQQTDPRYEQGYYWRCNSSAWRGPDRIYHVSSAFQTQNEAKDLAISNPYLNDIGKNFISVQSGGFSTVDESNSNTDGVSVNINVFKSPCSGATYDPVCELPPPKPKWPAVDKNHLNWNKEKGCFEPLCPELNTAVSDKFKECQKERILCDKDGNKVKVEVDGNGVKITQAKYNQTAEIKNGKVQTVKKLTESQTEAEFK